MNPYAKELILDLHNCNSRNFKRNIIERFFKAICIRLETEESKVSFCDYLNINLDTTTITQLINNDCITMRIINETKKVYINIFVNKEFDTEAIKSICKYWFESSIVSSTVIERE